MEFRPITYDFDYMPSINFSCEVYIKSKSTLTDNPVVHKFSIGSYAKYCAGGHLGFPFHVNNGNFARDHPMTIHVQLGVNHVYCF